MARMVINLPPDHERTADLMVTLAACARDAAAVRARLRSLAFNPDDDTILRCEEIEDRALRVLDKWSRVEAYRGRSL